jgi:hypothetical protein
VESSKTIAVIAQKENAFLMFQSLEKNKKIMPKKSQNIGLIIEK